MRLIIRKKLHLSSDKLPYSGLLKTMPTMALQGGGQLRPSDSVLAFEI
tara:strand:- start:697 stop:840 length:144 start_codon:yes stop_codon:yes gene_type:complete